MKRMQAESFADLVKMANKLGISQTNLYKKIIGSSAPFLYYQTQSSRGRAHKVRSGSLRQRSGSPAALSNA